MPTKLNEVKVIIHGKKHTAVTTDSTQKNLIIKISRIFFFRMEKLIFQNFI